MEQTGASPLFVYSSLVQRNQLFPLFVHEDYKDISFDFLPTFCFPTEQQLSSPLSFTFRFKSPRNDKFFHAFCLVDQTPFQLTDKLEASNQTCICIVSEFMRFKVFEKILKKIRSLLFKSIEASQNYLKTIIKNQMFSCTLELYNHNQKLYWEENVKTIKKKIGLNQFIGRIIMALLTDSSIIVVGSDLSEVSAFCYGLISIIFPLNWHHLFIPIMPISLIDSIQSPAPFLVGIHSSIITKLNDYNIEDHLLIDIDNEKIQEICLSQIPQKIINLYDLISDITYDMVQKFILQVICNVLEVQISNVTKITIKRIREKFQSTEPELNSFEFLLLKSRTLVPFFESLNENINDYFKYMISKGNDNKITSPAYQKLNEFPLKSKKIEKNVSLK